MTEWRMPEVMRQGDRLGEVFVQMQAARDGTGDLRDFDAVGQASAEQVALVVHEHLGLVFEAAERAGMDDAVAVALEFAAAVRRGLGNPAAARIDLADGVRRQTTSHRLSHARPRSMPPASAATERAARRRKI